MTDNKENIRLSDEQNIRNQMEKIGFKDSKAVKQTYKKPEWKNIKPAHEKLWIWQKAHKLHLEICNICKEIPNHEKYKLRQQIERSSKSVEDNIAEGNGSYYYNNKIKGLYTARKEVSETQNHLRDMEDKSYLIASKSQEMIDEYEEIKRGINGLVRSISKKKQK